MSVHTLDGYRLRVKRAGLGAGNPEATKPQWVEVEVPAEAGRSAAAAITLRMGSGTEVLLRPDFDRRALRAVLDVLEGR